MPPRGAEACEHRSSREMDGSTGRCPSLRGAEACERRSSREMDGSAERCPSPRGAESRAIPGSGDASPREARKLVSRLRKSE